MNMQERQILLACVLLLLLDFIISWPKGCNMTIGNRCYEIVTDKKYYSEARKVCESKEGRLATVTSGEISRILSKYMRSALGCHNTDHLSNRFWIGLSDEISEGTFIFSNGKRLTSNMFTAWEIGEPDNSESEGLTDCDCVSMSAFTGLWFDDFCSGHAKGFVCEYDGRSCRSQELDIPFGDEMFCNLDRNISFGTSFDMHCQEGFVLDGPKNVYCTGEGIWTRIPHCKRGCLHPKPFPHTISKDKVESYTASSRLTYLCEDNYYTNDYPTKSHFTIVCNERGMWTPSRVGCFPRKVYDVQEVRVEVGKEAYLSCLISEDVLQFTGNENWTWMKNSQTISQNQPGTFVFSNGTLSVSNITQDEEGTYSCYKSANNIIPGSRTYKLYIQSEECQSRESPLKLYSVQEGKSALLLCPHSNHYTAIEWFKDGERISNGQSQTIFADGSLLISRVQVVHQGNYTCRMVLKESTCVQNHTLELRVSSSVVHVCGNMSRVDDQPWTVSLWWDDETAPFCYGALIDDSWVLTSATCLTSVYRKQKLNAHVHFGKDLKYEESEYQDGGMDIPISAVKVHPKFSKRPYVYDIGLVKLNFSAEFTDDIQPVCLSDVDVTATTQCDKAPTVEGIVSGWGPLALPELTATSLSTEAINVVASSFCNETDMFFSDLLLCAKVANSTEGFNLKDGVADQGSPFTIQWKDRVYLLGVYTWGQRVSRLGFYDYFSKVPGFVRWIKSQIR